MKMGKEEFSRSLKEGLKYPWGKASRLWNILWVLFPVFGWFALAGYGKKIVKDLISGQTKELPAFGKFWGEFKEGVFIFVFMIPTIAVLMMLNIVPLVGWAVSFLSGIFLVPWLVMNFFAKETFESLWEVKKAYGVVTKNIVEYLFMYLKSIVYTAIYLVLCIVLVGIPCLAFGKNYYMAEFYRRHR